MSMTWHIFRKDWAQLWPLVAFLAIAQVTNAALWFELGHFKEPQGLVIVAQIFSYALLLGIAALITAAVQQDVLPGVSQDWLVRPIRRGALLRAKLLFVLMAGHGPMLLADLAHGMAAGFTFRDSLTAALSRNASLLLVFDLPVLAIAAMTRNLVQVAITMLAIWLVVVVGIAVGILARGGTPPPFAASGLQWMTPVFWSLLAFSAAAVIIPLQYFRRATTQARRIVVGVVLLAPILSFSTWESAFSVQQWLSRNPIITEPITIAFDPSLGKETVAEPDASAIAVLLPLRVSSLIPESIVMKDRADVRVVGRDGTTLFSGRTTVNIGYDDDFQVRTTEGGDVRTHQRIVFPSKIYELIRAQPVSVVIEYSLTLFHIEAANTISAMNGSERFAAFGWCRTKIDEDGDDIELGCVKTGRAPACITVTLKNPTNGKRNPENRYCDPDYTPYSAHFYPDSMSQFGGGIKFRDLQGLAKYPVDGSQLADALVILKSYRSEAHFTRRLVIPEIRLGEWAANAATAKASFTERSGVGPRID
jgi:hypothetical protein